jgi:hypothetical protein
MSTAKEANGRWGSRAAWFARGDRGEAVRNDVRGMQCGCDGYV